MIIQIRGTSGSGKTWAIKKWMENYDWEPEYQDGRKKPLLYRTWLTPDKSMVVLGHYESPCGGCDTIGSARQVFELIDSLEDDSIFVCEGLLLSEDVKWVSQATCPVRIVYLTTDIEKCVSQIKARRELVGNTKPLNESNTRNRVEVIRRSKSKLRSFEHVKLRSAPAKQVPKVIEDWVHG